MTLNKLEFYAQKNYYAWKKPALVLCYFLKTVIKFGFYKRRIVEQGLASQLDPDSWNYVGNYLTCPSSSYLVG
jgi:hypothetical protein